MVSKKIHDSLACVHKFCKVWVAVGHVCGDGVASRHIANTAPETSVRDPLGKVGWKVCESIGYRLLMREGVLAPG